MIESNIVRDILEITAIAERFSTSLKVANERSFSRVSALVKLGVLSTLWIQILNVNRYTP